MTSVNGKSEEIYYRIAPCGGVKCCAAEDCSYYVPNRERHPCPKHPDLFLVSSGECPVEFVYAWPVCKDDKRRWLSGIVRRDDMMSNNLHNHPLPAPTKVPAKVVHDIQQAVSLDSSLHTHDLVTCNECVIDITHNHTFLTQVKGCHTYQHSFFGSCTQRQDKEHQGFNSARN